MFAFGHTRSYTNAQSKAHTEWRDKANERKTRTRIRPIVLTWAIDCKWWLFVNRIEDKMRERERWTKRKEITQIIQSVIKQREKNTTNFDFCCCCFRSHFSTSKIPSIVGSFTQIHQLIITTECPSFFWNIRDK